MSSILLVLAGVTTLFFIFLLTKNFMKSKTKEKFCVICFAVISTWVALLILYWFDLFANGVILAILMGESSLGVFYFAEKIVKDKLKFFRLPFLLTLIVIVYHLIVPLGFFNSLIFMAGLWLFFILIFSCKNNLKINKFVNSVVRCCREW